MSILIRINDGADLEIRGDGRTLHGLAVPYNVPTRISSRLEGQFDETFRPGAFARTIRERGSKVRLHVLHDQTTRLPIGRATELREDPAGLVGEFRVSATRQGDEVLELVRDGALDGLSIGFRPIRDRWTKGRQSVERLEVALNEVSVVATPAYAGARIVGVRAATLYIPPGEAVDRLAALLKGTSQ
jgi:HK97 family phage prohead protease